MNEEMDYARAITVMAGKYRDAITESIYKHDPSFFRRALAHNLGPIYGPPLPNVWVDALHASFCNYHEEPCIVFSTPGSESEPVHLTFPEVRILIESLSAFVQ